MSAHDNDDVIFRLLAFVIMAGCLVLAASIPDLFADGKSTLAASRGHGGHRFSGARDAAAHHRRAGHRLRDVVAVLQA